MFCIKVEQKSEVRMQKGSRAGQALMEFVLGLMIVISFFFFFIKMSATFAVGNFIHYATFMSARAYMSSAKTPGDQQSNAETVLQKMVGGRWKALIKPDAAAAGSVPGGFVGPGPYAQDSLALDYWNQGVTYSYTSKLSIYPWSKEGQGIDLKLVSESWMPREQSESETLATKAVVEARIASAIGVGGLQVEWDNGY
jgi:hypothetical protein